MREGGGSILLDEEMCRPGERVPRYQRQRKQPPPADRNHDDQKAEGCQRADTMQPARGRLAVLAEVIWPEVGKRFELMIGHAKFRRAF